MKGKRRIHPLDQVVPDEALAELMQKLERLAARDPMAAKLLERLIAAGEAQK